MGCQWLCPPGSWGAQWGPPACIGAGAVWHLHPGGGWKTPGGPREPGRWNPAEICCLVAHGKEGMWGSVAHVGYQKNQQQLQDGEGFSHRRCPMTSIAAQEGNGAWSFLPLQEGRGGWGATAPSTALGSPALVGATGSPAMATCLSGNTARLRRAAEPPESPFGPHMPSHGAGLGQDLTLSTHIHEPAWSGKGIHSQDTAPGAHCNVVLGCLALQASPASPA